MDKREDDKEKTKFLILLLSIRTELSVAMKREKDLIGDIMEKAVYSVPNRTPIPFPTERRFRS